MGVNTDDIINKCFSAAKKVYSGTDATDSVKKTEFKAELINLNTLTGALESKINQNVIDNVILESTDNAIELDANIRMNQKRMNEIAEYKYNRVLFVKSIVKRFVYSTIIVIFITYLMNSPYFPSLVGKGLIILIVSINIYKFIMSMMWNFRRDEKYWDKYDQIVPKTLDASGNITLSKWEQNKKAFGKLSVCGQK
jgi:hypothetical protein